MGRIRSKLGCACGSLHLELVQLCFGPLSGPELLWDPCVCSVYLVPRTRDIRASKAVRSNRPTSPCLQRLLTPDLAIFIHLKSEFVCVVREHMLVAVLSSLKTRTHADTLPVSFASFGCTISRLTVQSAMLAWSQGTWDQRSRLLLHGATRY